MERFFPLVLVFIFTFHCLNCSEASQSDCGVAGNEYQILSLSVTNRRNESGEWVTSFSASKNTSDMTNDLDVFLVRSSISCKGNHFVNIKGTIKDNSGREEDRRLYFYKRSANAVITNNGRTLQRIKEEDPATALTHRPLLNDEIFTVRFDTMRNKREPGLGIGVTTHLPNVSELPDNIYLQQIGTWMFFETNLYQNSSLILKDYLRTSLQRDIKVGQTIGVMRSRYGALHFFLDGVDQGPAALNIPDKVYGAFETYYGVIAATIVDTR